MDNQHSLPWTLSDIVKATGGELLSGEPLQGFENIGIEWDYHEPLVLFFTADISMFTGFADVRFGLESYKDASTVEGSTAAYADFPIYGESVPVGTDSDPPEWPTTVGI